jgi:hypothetical protein
MPNVRSRVKWQWMSNLFLGITTAGRICAQKDYVKTWPLTNKWSNKPQSSVSAHREQHQCL